MYLKYRVMQQNSTIPDMTRFQPTRSTKDTCLILLKPTWIERALRALSIHVGLSKIGHVFQKIEPTESGNLYKMSSFAGSPLLYGDSSVHMCILLGAERRKSSQNRRNEPKYVDLSCMGVVSDDSDISIYRVSKRKPPELG